MEFNYTDDSILTIATAHALINNLYTNIPIDTFKNYYIYYTKNGLFLKILRLIIVLVMVQL
jgi:hypothetical protein